MDKSGTRRAAFFDFMDKKTWRDRGFPNVTRARHTIQDPNLRDLPGGSEQYGGQAIGLIDPTGKMVPTSSLKMAHGTYPVDLAGKYMGGFDVPLPRSILFPDWVAARRAAGGKVSSDNRAFMMQPTLQPTNQEWLDNVMKYREANLPR
jgi:hypothetical protein